MWSIIFLILLAVFVVSIIAQWKIYEKIGEPGRKSIIPYYNYYVLCGHVFTSALWFLIPVLCSVVGSLFEVNTIVYSVISVVQFLFMSTLNWKTYKCFSKSKTFCVIGVLFPIVTNVICAFDKSIFLKTKNIKEI